MNIGFDLDKVFIDYPPIFPSILFDKLYKKKDNGVLLYRIPTYPEQLVRKALHYPLLRPPIKTNLDFLRSIPKDKNKLYLISSRYKFLEGITSQLVKKHQLDSIFDGLYFNYENKQPHEFKNEVIKGLNLDLYIDDDLSLINYVAKHNRKTKFLWLNYRNHDKPKEKNVYSINQLNEIFKNE
jgi:hypothetical protein